MEFKEILLLLVTLGYLPSSFGSFEPAYLKVCGKNEKHVVDSKYCAKGIWLKYSLEPGCICVRGVWALSNGFCDEKSAIIVGDGHCFHIGFEIRSAKLIGDPADPFQPKIYAAPSSLDAFYELKEGEYTPALLSDSTFIIGVNPRQVAQRKDFGVCLDLPPDEWNKPVQIYVNPRRSIKEWTLNPKDTFNCPVVSSYKHHVGFGDMFMNDRVEPKLLVERNCIDDCPGANVSDSKPDPTGSSKGPMGRSLLESTQSEEHPQQHSFSSSPAATSPDTELPTDQLIRTFTKLYSHHRPKKTQEEIQQEKDEARAKAEEDEDDFAKETNEQTLRMMHAHISPVLLNISGAQVITPAYKYFQVMRQVVEKACPKEFVPPLVLRGLMRMFRHLLWETQDTFTPITLGDEDSHRRTMEVLNHCLNLTTEPAIVFHTLNESYSNNTVLRDTIPLVAQWPNWAIPPERCPEPVIFSLNGSFYDSNGNVPFFSMIRNISMIGIHMKFNSSLLDFVVETAWKIAIMGTFRCSNFFNDTSFTDYYTFSEQMRSFFNSKILKRWYYKPSVDNTYQIVKMVFPSYDLKKFAFGIDACMLGLHRFGAEYRSERIVSRPKIQGTEEDLTQFVKYFDREHPDNLEAIRTHAMNTYDYAPKPEWPSILFPKPGDKYPEQHSHKGKRRKRDTSSSPSPFNLWGNKATCIRTYMEPWIKQQDFGYHVPPGCISPTGVYRI